MEHAWKYSEFVPYMDNFKNGNGQKSYDEPCLEIVFQ